MRYGQQDVLTISAARDILSTIAVLGLSAVVAACGGVSPSSGAAEQVLTLRVETAPGRIEFDRERLTARAGRITFVLINEKWRGHNIRIHRGDVRGLPLEASDDLGGTQTIGTGRTRAVVELAPGVYTYLCSAGAHWHTQHGLLVVSPR